MTLQNEKPELEVRKTELLKQEEDLKIQLSKLEDSLLEVGAVMYYFCFLNKTMLLFKLMIFIGVTFAVWIIATVVVCKQIYIACPVP